MQVPAMFVKLMMMTTSESDGEALTAIRKANAMLAQANVNWEEFLAIVETSKQAGPQSQPPPRSNRSEDFEDVGKSSDHYTDADTINALFERCFRNTPSYSSFRDFLDSVHSFWEINGYLTEKQYHAIQRSAARRR
jgi:hypothetical protein